MDPCVDIVNRIEAGLERFSPLTRLVVAKQHEAMLENEMFMDTPVKSPKKKEDMVKFLTRMSKK